MGVNFIKILNFDYFKKMLIFQLYKVWNRKWRGIALKILSKFKLNDDQENKIKTTMNINSNCFINIIIAMLK